MKKIYEELSRIQQNLKAPKNLFNSFGNYKYRNAEGILEAVKPLLNGMVLLLSDEIELIGSRYYVKATATLTDGEDSISVSARAREDETKKGMDGCQITGACSSYARKYALNGLFDIDDTKDSDDDSLSPKNPKNQEKPQEPKKTDPSASVTRQQKLPEAAQDTPEEPQQKTNPVQEYLQKEMKGLREARGITIKENNELFKKQFEALIKAGLAPDKKLADYTLEEAHNLIASMYLNFKPEGEEVKA